MCFFCPRNILPLRLAQNNGTETIYKAARTAEAVAWRKQKEKAFDNENNKIFQLANIKTFRYDGRVAMNLDDTL